MAELALNITARNQAQAVLNSLGSGLGKVAAQAKTAQQQLAALGAGMTSAGTALTAGVTAPLLGFAAASIKAAADNEQLAISFTTMLGSAEKAKVLMGELEQFAASTPFSQEEVVTAGKQLLAFGVTAEDIQPTLTQLGDLAAGIGAPVGDLAYLFGTAKAQGRLFMADVNQFSSRGIPMIEALAATMGVAQTDVRKLIEEGKVGFPEMQAALAHLTGEGSKFGGLMDAQSASLSGLFSTLQDNIAITLRTIGQQLIESFDLKGKLEQSIAFMVKIKDAIVNFAKTNPQMFKMALTIGAVAAAIGPLLIGLGMITTWIAAALPALAAVAGAFSFLLGPIGLVVAALGAAFYFDIGGIRGRLAEIGAWFQKLVDVFKTGEFKSLGGLLVSLGIGRTQAYAFAEAFGGVVRGAQDLFAAFQRGDLFTVFEDGSSYIGEFMQTLGMSEEKANALGLAIYDIKGAFDRGGLAEAFTIFEDGSSYIGGFIQALGVSEETVQGVGRAIYSLKEAFTGTDFAAFTTSAQDALSNIGTAISDYFSGDISLGGLATAVSDGFIQIKDAITTFFGGADFGQFLTAIKWNEFIEKLSWENVISKLTDWGAWIKSLDWTSIVTTAIDWALWIPVLAWTAFIKTLDWGFYIVSLAWDGFIKILDWATVTGDGIKWSDFIGALDWATFITKFAWNSFIEKLEWTGAIATLTNWSEYITDINWSAFIEKINWTAGIIQILDWATWIVALPWNAFVKFVDWSIYLSKLNWAEHLGAFLWNNYVSKLTWKDVITGLSWVAFINPLSWPALVASINWDSYIVKVTWANFVEKLNWPDWLSGLTWSDWLEVLSWSKFVNPLEWVLFVSGINLADYIPTFPGWKALVRDFLPDGLGLVGGSGGYDDPNHQSGGSFKPGHQANGTDNWKGGWTWVGERGPELVNLPKGSQVLSNTDSKAMIGQLAEGTTSLGQAMQNVASPFKNQSRGQLVAGELIPRLRETVLSQIVRPIEDASKTLAKDVKASAQDLTDAMQSAARNTPGLFSTSEVTDQQLKLAELGVPQSFADDWIRRLTDEVVNGVDWADTDIKDAAMRAGIDPGLPAKVILDMVKAQWNDQSFFANGNTDLINMDAFQEQMRKEAASKAGEANLLAFLGIPQDQVAAQGKELGKTLRTGISQAMTATTAEGEAGTMTNFGADFASIINGQLEGSEAFAATGSAILAKIVESWSDLKTIAVDLVRPIADAINAQLDTSSAIDMLKNTGARMVKIVFAGFDEEALGLNWVGSVASAANNTTAAEIPGNANGTSNWRGGLSWVGERGPELVNLPRGSQVFNNRQSLDLTSGGGGGMTIVVNVSDTSLSDTRKLARELAYETAMEIRRKGLA